MRQSLILVCTFCLVSVQLQAQDHSLRKTDRHLTHVWNRVIRSLGDWDKVAEKTIPAFRKELLAALEDPATFRGNLDSLGEHINIVSTPDGKVKFYSWDDFTGGSSHEMEYVAQYMTPGGEVKVKILTSSAYSDYANSLIYEAHAYQQDGITYYILFGWGTFGEGLQYNVVQSWYLQGDDLLKYVGCFAEQQDLVFEYPRACEFHLAFEENPSSIVYDDLKSMEEGRYSGIPSAGKVTLRLVDGVFRKVE